MAKSTISAIVAGHDCGGLNVLAPLLRAWIRQETVEAHFMSTPMVCREMGAQVDGLVFPEWVEGITEHMCANAAHLDAYLSRHLNSGRWDVILCSTSAYCLLEKRLIRVGNELGIPTIALCDMWWAYSERFRDGNDWCIPDVLWVLDNRMMSEAGSVTWPNPPRIEVVGSPLFQELLAMRSCNVVSSDGSGAIRFVSEPASTKFPLSRINEFALAEQLVLTARSIGIENRIVIRTHPADPLEQWRRWVWRLKDFKVELDFMPLQECIADTAKAIGISSILLSEMAVCGIPTASLQMLDGDTCYYCLPFEEFGIQVLSSNEELSKWLLSDNQRVEVPKVASYHLNSIERITDRIYELAKDRNVRKKYDNQS
jgi:hypothetical protein